MAWLAQYISVVAADALQGTGGRQLQPSSRKKRLRHLAKVHSRSFALSVEWILRIAAVLLSITGSSLASIGVAISVSLNPEKFGITLVRGPLAN